MMRTFLKITLIGLVAAGFVCSANAQEKAKSKPAILKTVVSEEVRSSPAYAELLLKRTELESEVESLLLDHTESFPKVVEDRYHLAMIDILIRRVAAVKAPDAGKLSLALGKLMTRQAELETDLWGLKLVYTESNNEVKRAAKKLAIYDAAIKDILGF